MQDDLLATDSWPFFLLWWDVRVLPSNQHAGGYYEDLLVEIRTDESFQYFHTVMGNGRAGRDNGEAETMWFKGQSDKRLLK